MALLLLVGYIMKKNVVLIAFLCVLGSSNCLGQSQLELENEKYREAVDLIGLEYLDKLKAVNGIYAKRLNELKVKATEAGLLDEAIAFRDRANQLLDETDPENEKLPEKPSTSESRQKAKLVEYLAKSKWDVARIHWNSWSDGWVYFREDGYFMSYKNRDRDFGKVNKNDQWFVFDPNTVVLVLRHSEATYVHMIQFDFKQNIMRVTHIGQPGLNNDQAWWAISRSPAVPSVKLMK